jgi:hypothetical protein
MSWKFFNNACPDETFFSIPGNKIFFDFLRNLALGQNFGLYFKLRNIFQDPLEALSSKIGMIGVWVA